MKKLAYVLVPALILASCSGPAPDKATELAKLKKEKSDLDAKIKTLEAGSKDSVKVTPVSVTEMRPVDFVGYVEVQAQINGDEVVNATARTPGTVLKVLVQAGQHVHQGQLLATLDATVIEQNIKALDPTLGLQKSLYEKQQKLWAQNIGTEVQLMTAKAQYEATQKQRLALEAQRDMYSIVSPIGGVVDAVNVKVGDPASPGMNGFHIVNLDKMKAEANLGENYIGKVHNGDPVTLVFSEINDSIKTRLTYVSEAVDPVSRSFLVQIRLGSSKLLHPNMSCIMKIANYENKNAITVPVSVIQRTSKGDMLYVIDGNKAKAVYVKSGRNQNGLQEILSGLNPGDRVITAGFEDLNDGDAVTEAK